MKKFNLLILLLFIPLLGCSKSDEEEEGKDEIFALEYKGLTDLDVLKNKVFYYVGIKRGDSKTSVLVPNSKSCRAQEYFTQARSDAEPTLDFGYIVMENGTFGCEQTTSVYFLDSELEREGVLKTQLKYGESVPMLGIVLHDGGPMYSGEIEIGFQGEYLRIEDKMSSYIKADPNEKVYLYFSLQRR